MTLPHQQPRGTRFAAGLGVSTVLPDMDFETRSQAGYVWVPPMVGTKNTLGKWAAPAGAPKGSKKGLFIIGAAAYAEHPTTDIISLAYDLKAGAGPQVWIPGMAPPLPLFAWLAEGGLVEAWNAAFERLIWRHVGQRRYGWPALPTRQLRCAMAKARAHGLPGKLEIAGEVLALPVQKDKRGKELLDKFSVPNTPSKAKPWIWASIMELQHAVDGQGLIEYNITDIQAEASIAAQCPDLEGEELDFWLADQAINERGVHIDRAGVENCIAIIEAAHARYNDELYHLTAGAVNRASETKKLKEWLAARGVNIPNMQEETLDDWLDENAATLSTTDPHGRRALEIRQAIGSASVKKTFAMRLQVCADDRLRDLFSYHAARTGRPTGNGPQPTNLPKAGPEVYKCACGRHSSPPLACAWCGMPRAPGVATVEWCVEAAEDALAVIATRDLATVERYFLDAMLAVSGCLRSLFMAAPGHDLICSDFTAIEAVVLAMLAGEKWREDVFRVKTDIYLESISRSDHVSMEELKRYKTERKMHHPLRQKGKIQELSLGYGGWIGAVRSMGKTLGIEITESDAEIKARIVAWRAASPAVVEFWGGQSRDFGRVPGMFGLEGAVVAAIQNPGRRFDVQRLDGTSCGVSYLVHGDVLYCTLPSGRHLAYHRPRLTDNPPDKAWRGKKITFEGYNTNQKKGKPGWMTMDLYGGLLAENVTQAVARDIQRFAIVNLERRGYPVVLHVYDEDVSEIPEGWGSTAEYETIMGTMPAWAEGWPISAAGGWRGKRYRKG